jgi:hypothetical protein
MATLSAEGRLTTPSPAGFQVPEEGSLAGAALGYLHANCGNCHNPTGVALSMSLRLSVSDVSVTDTDTYQTAVNQPTEVFWCDGCDRIEPGNAAASAIVQRMSIRGGTQMPPIGTEVVDATGVNAVTAWINAL